MLAAVKSDYYLIRGYLRTYALVFLFMIAMAAVQGAVFFFFFYASFISVFLPFTLMSLSEQSGWETMLLAAPISRTSMVGGRYLICLLFSLFSGTVGIGAATALQPDMLLENLQSMLASIAMTQLVLSVLIPIIYRFGSQKSRLILMALAIMPSVLASVASSNVAASEFVGSVFQLLSSLPALLVCNLICFFLLCLSFFISCFIYKRKEF